MSTEKILTIPTTKIFQPLATYLQSMQQFVEKNKRFFEICVNVVWELSLNGVYIVNLDVCDTPDDRPTVTIAQFLEDIITQEKNSVEKHFVSVRLSLVPSEIQQLKMMTLPSEYVELEKFIKYSLILADVNTKM